MWVIDLIIECRKAKQRKENKRTWLLDIQGLLKRRDERRNKERSSNVKQKWW